MRLGVQEVVALTRSGSEKNVKTANLQKKGITELGDLSKLTGLRNIDLSGNELRDISLIAKVESLKYLKVGKNKLASLKGVENFAGSSFLSRARTN